MKQYFFYSLFFLFLFSSCATLFNKPYKTVSISTSSPTKICYLKDTFLVNQEIKLIATRKKDPLIFKTINDSIQKEYHISSTISPTVYYNILGYGGLIGIVIDLFSKKKYSYPHYISISPKDSLSNYETFRTTHQRDVFFNINFPLLNFAGHQTNSNTIINTFNSSGFGVGVDYFYSDKNFINFSLNSVNDLYTLIESSTVSDLNYIDKNRENYVSITHNHQIKKIFVGYGLSIGRNFNDPAEYTNFFSYYPTPFLKNEVNYAAGLLVNTYIQAGKYLNIGLIYRPSIYTLNSTQPLFNQYYIGMDLRYRFRLKKGSNTNNSKFRDNFKHILFPK